VAIAAALAKKNDMATRTTKENVQISLSIDGKEAVNQVKELDSQASKLLDELFKLEEQGLQTTEAYRKLKVQHKELLDQSNKAYEATKKAAEQQARLAVNEGKSLKQLQNEYRQLNAIVSNLEPSHKDFNKQVELLHAKKAKIDDIKASFKGVKEETGGMLERLKSGIGAIAAFFAVDKLVQWGRQALNLYNEAARGEAQLQAVLKSTGEVAGRSLEQLKRQQAELQGFTLFDDDATAQAQALLLTFTKVRTEVFDASIPLIQDYATAMATASGETVDLKSATIQVGKALNDPLKGLVALGKAGVQFTAEQKEQITVMVESGRVADAQRVILKELETQFGGSARAAAEAGTGGLTQFTNRLNNMIEVIGELLFKRMEPLLGIGNKILGFFEELVEPVNAAAAAFDEQAAKVKDLEENMVPLLDRYDELKSKTNLTKGEQEELKKIVEQVAAAVPSAVTAFGKYGEALDINTEAARHFIEIEKARLQFIHQDAIATIENQIRTMETLRDRTLALRKSGGELVASGSGLTGVVKKFTEDELRGMDAELGKIKFSIEGANAELARLKGDGFVLPDAPKKTVGEDPPENTGGNANKEAAKKKLQADQKANEEALKLAAQKTEDERIRALNAEVQNISDLEAQKLQIKIDYAEQAKNISQGITDNFNENQEEQARKAKETADKLNAIEAAKYQFAQQTFSGIIQLLSADEQARKKNAKAIKAFSTAEVFTNLFQEVSGIWKNANTNPLNAIFPGAGTAIAVVQSAFAAARAQLAVGNIQKQKFAKGGALPQGPSHAQGGIKLVSAGNIVGEIEGGEPILSKDTYRNNKPLVDRLLYSSMYRGGAPIFATGGFVPGGSGSIVGAASLSQSTQRMEAMTEAMLMETKATRQAIEAIPTTLRADVSLRTIQDAETTLGDIRKAAAL
jgi:hypothetical protein